MTASRRGPPRPTAARRTGQSATRRRPARAGELVLRRVVVRVPSGVSFSASREGVPAARELVRCSCTRLDPDGGSVLEDSSEAIRTPPPASDAMLVRLKPSIFIEGGRPRWQAQALSHGSTCFMRSRIQKSEGGEPRIRRSAALRTLLSAVLRCRTLTTTHARARWQAGVSE